MTMLAKDLKEAAAIERRRRFEDERKTRIFDPRRRIIGVDEAALRVQIQEQKARESEEQRLNEAYEQQQLRDAQLAILLEKQTDEHEDVLTFHQRFGSDCAVTLVSTKHDTLVQSLLRILERLRVNKAINTFRSVYQRPEQRREFDLYDPDSLKKALPARVADDDPRCTVSSAQRFAGEDLSSKERLRAQMQQQRAWLEQQMAERQTAEETRKAAEDVHQQAVVSRDRTASQLDRMERECRRRLDKAVSQFNKALAEEQEAQRQLDEARDVEDKRAEIYNLMSSEMLTENVDVAKSNLGEHRVVSYMYKGMTPEQLDEIRQHQLQQIQEQQARKAAEDQYNSQWDKFTADMSRLVMLKDRELVRKQRELSKNMLQRNQQLCEEQKARQEYLDKVVFTNEPTPQYFQQFNTTSR